MEVVLRVVQFSMLTLRDLVSTIAAKLQERLLEGTEIYGRKNNRIYPCKIVKILDLEVNKTQYQVAWLDKDKKVTEIAVVSEDDLIKKKLPCGRDVLKSFIRESTCTSVPWVLHDKLALKYGISTDSPEELKREVLSKSGDRKRKCSDKDGVTPWRQMVENLSERNWMIALTKITLVTWMDYVCDFLELVSNAELSACVTTIRRGRYGLLDIHAKLGIFLELVAQTLATDIMREKLDEYVEERQALAARRQGQALEEGRKRREKKESAKVESNGKEVLERRSMDSVRSNSSKPVHCSQNGDVSKFQKEHTSSCQQKHIFENSGKKQRKTSKKDVKRLKADTELTIESIKLAAAKGSKKLMNVEKNEIEDKKNTEQSKQYLEREMEKRFVRSNPLGRDRDYNRYWFFRKDARIFVESSDHNQWGCYGTKDELDSLIGSLNQKGERERALSKQLEKHYNRILGEIQKRSKEARRIEMDEEGLVRRSSRVCAPPKENPALAFVKYVNKLRED